MGSISEQKNIVVIGAGVAGLTTALYLSKNPRYRVVVAAKHMPGDYDIEYASPWAGANWVPVSVRGTEAAEWDRQTWYVFDDLASNHLEAGVHYQVNEIHTRKKDTLEATDVYSSESLSLNPWYKDIISDFTVLPESELREGIVTATRFTSVCINTAIYLPWLMGQCLKYGVICKRGVFKHVLDCTKPGVHPGGHVDLVVNCTGLMACRLGGVMDPNMTPIRGQLVIVRNESCGTMINFSGTDDGETEACYTMERAAGGGTIIGGTYERGNWESAPDPNMSNRIMTRIVKAFPEITGGKGIEALDVIRYGVGLRPDRAGGTRVEKEQIDGTWVVHNYGAGPAGYQNSHGCGMAAARLVDSVFGEETPCVNGKVKGDVNWKAYS